LIEIQKCTQNPLFQISAVHAHHRIRKTHHNNLKNIEESDEEEIEDDLEHEATSLLSTSTHFNKESIFEQGWVF
jgi:hypothetical protein